MSEKFQSGGWEGDWNTILKPTFKDKQKTLFGRLKKLRCSATPAELALLGAFKKFQVKHIFQKAFIQGDYYCIVDFYLPRPLGLAIEVDGDYHQTSQQQRKDWAKDNYLRNRKIKVLRFTNRQVLLNPETVVKHILET